MKLSKHLAAAALAVPLALGVAACTSSNATGGQTAEQQTSNQDLTTYEQVQPAPHFPYSVIRQDIISVEAAQALGEQTTSFFFNQGVRDPIFSCPSIGDPIPNTAQLTNPSKIATGSNSQGYWGVTIGNIDPNGVYAPAASSGTNVMCLNAQGRQYLQYWEGFVDTVNGAAHWNAATGQIVVTGQPQMPSCRTQTVHSKPESVCTK